MTIAVGPMDLEQPEPLDDLETYFTGTMPSGGYWTILSRLSAHDHSGGLLGNPVAVDIPDGSITAPDLHPSVLLPYALTDGSKPFTGQVTMQADAVLRDALRFGEQGSALAPDVTLTRTAAGALAVATAPSGGTPLTTRMALAQTGTLTLTPDVGVPGVALNKTGAALTHVMQIERNGTRQWSWMLGASQELQVWESTLGAARISLAQNGSLALNPDAGQPGLGALGSWVPTSNLWAYADNGAFLGYTDHRYSAVYAVSGTINTSSREYKEGITPLDPQRAMEAVRATEAVTFDYIAPPRTAAWYDLPDDPEQAQRVLEDRLTAAPLEAAARHQHGFIAEDCDPLFLVGEGQTSPGSSIGVLLAALQNLDSRLQTLETP